MALKHNKCNPYALEIGTVYKERNGRRAPNMQMSNRRSVRFKKQ